MSDPVPLVPGVSIEGQPLDLSLSTLRAVSPIHIEYLRNMGVGASLSISIVIRGKLWGLFACHHYSPRVLPYSLRTVAELFSQLFSLLLDRVLTDAGNRLSLKGRDVATIEPGRTLSEAARILAERRIGALLIVDGHRPVTGIISERDIVRAVAAHGAKALDESLFGEDFEAA